MARYDDSVFVNCPFDAGYRPLFDAILFTLLDLGFEPRCALEADDGAEVRLAKIERIIEQCRYGIHDLSTVELDAVTGLPRFNMPLELGLFLGCRRFGGRRHHRKSALILDGQPYRYRAFISDISGQDIHAHGQDPHRAVREVRDWLAAASRRQRLPGGAEIGRRYRTFQADLPVLCAGLRRNPNELTFGDLVETIRRWLDADR